jgi:hypothetical protein
MIVNKCPQLIKSDSRAVEVPILDLIFAQSGLKLRTKVAKCAEGRRMSQNDGKKMLYESKFYEIII